MCTHVQARTHIYMQVRTHEHSRTRKHAHIHVSIHIHVHTQGTQTSEFQVSFFSFTWWELKTRADIYGSRLDGSIPVHFLHFQRAVDIRDSRSWVSGFSALVDTGWSSISLCLWFLACKMDIELLAFGASSGLGLGAWEDQCWGCSGVL